MFYLKTSAKLYASLFSAVQSPVLSVEIMNNDLIKTSESSYHWKMFLNPGCKKTSLENCSPSEIYKGRPPKAYFNNVAVAYSNCQRHLGIIAHNHFFSFPHS